MPCDGTENNDYGDDCTAFCDWYHSCVCGRYFWQAISGWWNQKRKVYLCMLHSGKLCVYCDCGTDWAYVSGGIVWGVMVMQYADKNKFEINKRLIYC